MPRYAYDRLTALDNSFLVLEKPNAYMHVASTITFESGPLRTPEGGVDIDAIKRLTAAKLHLIPRYRQKLQYIPFEGRPVWVDDDRFSIDYHVRHTSLPRPGTLDQLKRMAARIMQTHLDRSKPLWETWIVEGVEGDRFAMISKVHHCMIDGVSGVDLLNILLSPDPAAEVPLAPAFVPRPAPKARELLLDEIWRRVTLPLQTLGDVRRFAREAQDVRRELAVRGRALADMLGWALRRPSETPLNEPIGPNRRFDWLTMDIDEIKLLRRALGGSLNDVVLATVAGAVRQFLLQRRVALEGLDFRVMAPVSVRRESQRGALGNAVSAWIVPLPLAEPDPIARFRAICEVTAQLKESKQAVAAEALTQAADWMPSTLLSLGARNATRLLPFNLVVTNVPGPQVPMYMLGARMLESYPNVPLTDRLGLGIALLSYAGRLHWGFNGDYDLLPDLDLFVQAVGDAYHELRKAAVDARPADLSSARERTRPKDGAAA